MRYLIDDGQTTVPNLSTPVPGFPGQNVNQDQYIMLSWQHSFSSGLLNEAKLSFNRTNYRSLTLRGFWLLPLGLPPTEHVCFFLDTLVRKNSAQRFSTQCNIVLHWCAKIPPSGFQRNVTLSYILIA